MENQPAITARGLRKCFGSTVAVADLDLTVAEGEIFGLVGPDGAGKTTTCVDPVSRREFWRLLYRLPAEGVTLVVSTPYLDEAERCHRLAFMGGGRILAADTPTGLLGEMPYGVLELRLSAEEVLVVAD